MAEARSAVSEPRVNSLDEGKDAGKDFLRAWRKAFFRRFFRTRNLIRNGMWPTSIWNLGIGVAVFSVLLTGNWSWAEPVNTRLWYLGDCLHIPKGIPFFLRMLLISSVGGVAFFIVVMYKRRWLLRVLLSYRCWMYEPPHSQSLSTKIWGLVVRLVSGYHPTMYSYQKSLPFLPVPDLSHTMNGFLESIKPLYGEDSEEFQAFRKEAEEFEKTAGTKVQKIIVLKSWWAQNWVTDWWEKYVYLMSRTPIAINSNYYVLDQNNWTPTHRPVSRAASTIYQYMSFKRLIDREELEPLVIRNTIPICMAQYERLFSTTRIPGEDLDELVRYSSAESKHVVVMRKGLYYRLDVVDVEGQLLSPQVLEKQLQWIVDDADKHQEGLVEEEGAIAALTGLERTEWARLYREHFSAGVNRESIDILQKAIFHVILETKSFNTWSERGKYLLHGDGKTIWFDKSLNLVIFNDGSSGLNAEHSWGDAPVVGHCSEYNLTKEVVGRMYTLEGFVMPISGLKQAATMQPSRLVWQVEEPLKLKITSAIQFNQQNNEDLALCIKDHTSYGKGFMKTCKISPDAYIQMALQLTYYKLSGKLALTYESSMTRLYLLGRTETVRSLTCQAADFVRAMTDKGASNEERIQCLREAGDKHQKLYRDAMNGSGIDRHLFGLLVVCKGLGYSDEFLKKVLMIPWTLSTSQQPQQQIASSPDCSQPHFKDMLSPGGGFGPVSDMGYGVSYMVAGESRIFFHVSSKKSSKVTDSVKFMDCLFETLAEMRKAFEDFRKS